MNKHLLGCVAFAMAAVTASAMAQSTEHAHRHPNASAPGPDAETRELVHFPEPLRIHTLANMRAHLQVLSELQRLLAAGAFDKAASLAESNLGLSSLQMHGAQEVSKYMPKGMQEAGSAMHRSASRLSGVALESAVTGDARPALEALADVTANCVACHASYRFQ